MFSTPVFTILSITAQQDFYDAPTADRPFKAAEVSLWTSMAAGTSLTTACIPSIRRFLADWAAGVSNQIMGDADIPLSTFNNSKSSQSKSNALGGSLPTNRSWAQGGRQQHMSRDDDGDSRKGLTGQITQTVDFTVHSERLEGDRSGHSRNQSRDSSEDSLAVPYSSTVGSSHLDRSGHSSRQRFA